MVDKHTTALKPEDTLDGHAGLSCITISIYVCSILIITHSSIINLNILFSTTPLSSRISVSQRNTV